MTNHAITMVATFFSLIIAVTLHEAAHGYVAQLFGDSTAKEEGRLTLNPLAHADFFGTFFLPLVLFISGSPFLFGYAKPVPVNERKLSPLRLGKFCVASAGIVMNLLLAIFSGLLTHINPGGETFGNDLLFALIKINLVLAAFNLIPILPLDGGRMLNSLLPIKTALIHGKSEPYGMIILFILVFLPSAFHSLGLSIDPLMIILKPIYTFLSSLILFFVQ